MVIEHFGHCEEFMVFDTENNQIVKSETIANPGHEHEHHEKCSE